MWDAVLNDHEIDAKNRQIRKEVKKRAVYKLLAKRKFISPKGYRDFESIILAIALNIELAELGLDLAASRWVWLCAIALCFMGHLDWKQQTTTCGQFPWTIWHSELPGCSVSNGNSQKASRIDSHCWE